MKSYILTERARTGLSAIASYVSHRFDVDVAITTVEKIENACQILAENPGLGHRREDLTSEEFIRFGLLVQVFSRITRLTMELLSSSSNGVTKIGNGFLNKPGYYCPV